MGVFGVALLFGVLGLGLLEGLRVEGFFGVLGFIRFRLWGASGVLGWRESYDSV